MSSTSPIITENRNSSHLTPTRFLIALAEIIRAKLWSIVPGLHFHGRVRLGQRFALHITRGATLSVTDARIYPGVRIHLDSATASVSIGPSSYVNRNTQILSESAVRIGKGVAISWDVTICDTDYHDGISESRSAPIEICDEALIGMQATILKGVRIGKGAIVAAGSIVTRDVPDYTLVAGIPARVLKRNATWR